MFKSRALLTFLTQPRECGTQDVILNRLHYFRSRCQDRRIDTHAAGVGTFVTVVGALVVLTDGQIESGDAVGKCRHADLLAVQKLLYDHGAARVAKLLIDHDIREGLNCILFGVGDYDALARCETVRFYHKLVLDRLDVRSCCIEIGERHVLGGGDVVSAHEILCETLGSSISAASLLGAKHGMFAS